MSDEYSKYAPRITDVEQFVGWSRECAKNFGLRAATRETWFRGQADWEWVLKPSIYRQRVNPDYEREMIREFRAYASPLLAPHYRSDIDWLFTAQHHGLPTRILDWTSNALVALYFACENYEKEDDACVWALNPWELNRSTISMQSVPLTDSVIFKDYVIDLTDSTVPRKVFAALPLAVSPGHRFQRSNVQSGNFTIHGYKQNGIQSINFVRRNWQKCISKACIDGKRKFFLLKQLNALGINKFSLFQSVDSVSEYLSFRFGRDFLK